MAFFRSHTPIFKDEHGNKIENSIAEMKMIDINGTKQFVLIRGENKLNPVLLVVHGGPGSPETALFRYYNHELEKHYVVVYWEQRGCGKSYSKDAFKEPFTLEIFVDDACKLTEYLKAPKKSLIWFEKSAHCSCFEEADKFNSVMINDILNEIEI